ncbi:MAG TPA: hypothetical protein VF318_00225 [Dehalococcoidales bacterium]|jgi:hypothetical protein
MKRIKIVRKAPVDLGEVIKLKKRPDAEFWKGKSIEELKIEQGVKPFDVRGNGKNWPKDANFEEFTAAINSGRKYPRDR